jgi:nitroreductase
MEKKADTSTAIDDLLADRWSPRAFNPEYLLNEDQIHSLLEAARWAPSCRGEQPWYFVLFNKSNATTFSQALNCLSVSNQDWAMDSSLLIVACANRYYRKDNSENFYAHYDVGAAAENICLQSTALGLAAHQMGGFDKAKVATLVNAPKNYDILSVIAIGLPEKDSKIRSDLMERECAERNRLQLDQIFNYEVFKKD